MAQFDNYQLSRYPCISLMILQLEKTLPVPILNDLLSEGGAGGPLEPERHHKPQSP